MSLGYKIYVIICAARNQIYQATTKMAWYTERSRSGTPSQITPRTETNRATEWSMEFAGRSSHQEGWDMVNAHRLQEAKFSHQAGCLSTTQD